MHEPLTHDVDALPFLVVHGGWFWIVVMVAAAITMAGLGRLIRNMLALVHARAVVAELRTSVVSTLRAGETVIAGRWNGGSLVVADESVALGEQARIVLGTRGDVVDENAEVVVKGDLVRVSSMRSEAVGYRDDAGSWRLENAEIYATRPRARAQTLTWPVRTVGFLLGLLVAYVTMRIVGDTLIDRVSKRDYHAGTGQPLQISELDAVSIAASMPGSRHKALKELEHALEVHPFRDVASVRRQLGLDKVLHGNCGVLRLLRARPEEQLAMARRCRYDKAVFDILLDLGKYEEAWRSRPKDLEWPDQVGMVAIAIGKWREAAEEAEKLAALNHDEATRRGHSREYRLADALRYRCLAQWFRVLAGDTGAADKLRALAAAPGNPPVVCAPMVAQTLPVDERKAYLREALNAPRPVDADHLMHAVFATNVSLWLEGENTGFTRYEQFDISRPLAAGDLAVHEWLSTFGVEPWRAASDPRELSIALGGIVLREVHRGDFAAARSAAHEAAEALRDGDDEYRQSVARSWFSFIALREGQRELPPREYVDTYMDALKVRRGEPETFGLNGYPEACDALLDAAVRSGQAGDGRSLARAMQSCSVHAGSGFATLIGVLPLVQQGRDEVASALRWWSKEFGTRAYRPFSSLAYAAARRDIARFVGDDESARHWGEMAKRFIVLLEDRTRTLALVLWHH